MAEDTERQDEKAVANDNEANEDGTGRNGAGKSGVGKNGAGKNGDEKREGFSDPLEFLNAELEKAEAEKASVQEQMLRLAAEMENLRRRTQKDIADARSYSIANFAREMLAVSDNLRRALDAVSDEARQGADESLKSVIEGVELTERSMQQALEKNGVKRISPLNERFDPHFHQAMFEIPNPDVPSNTVLQVVQDGYTIGERVLRPAMVGVSKGGPKAPRSDDENGDTAGAAESAESAEKDDRAG